MPLTDEALALDAADPLAGLRAEFDLEPGVVYLDGNSLGPPPRSVAERLSEVVRTQWGGRLIRSWTDGWWETPQRVGDRIAPLVGAAPGQVVVGDSTSVNVFKAVVAAVRLTPGRDEILVDAGTFPTDGYLASSAARLTGATVVRAPLGEGITERTAVVLANHVDYRTGALADLPGLTAAAHRAGARVVWDLSHSVGVLPVGLDAAGVDLAVGCTYKFLNGGPGAPAFLYVAAGLQDRFDQPLPGWAGHAEPFAMAEGYDPAAGVVRARTGTPEILAQLALDAALDVWDRTTLAEVRAKGLALTGFFMRCVDDLVGLPVLTPRTQRRGHQVSLRCASASDVMTELIAREVIGDFREPDVLRFGFAPLYVGYADALRAAEVLADVLAK